MKKINILLILFLTLISVNLVLAEEIRPCQFWGTIMVNEENSNFSFDSVTAYTLSEGNEILANFSYPNLTEIPLGNYGIRINNVNSGILFKINEVKVNQESQNCVEGGSTSLDLTATINNFDGSTEEDVETNVEDLGITIGNSSDLSQGFFGEQEVEFKEGNETIVLFDFDFDLGTLNLSEITITQQDANSTIGSIEISGVNLTTGQTKTAYIDNIANENYVCVKDEDNAKVFGMTSDCSGDSETPVPCDGTLTSGYTCVVEGSKLKVTGLKHSAVEESTYSPPVVTTTSSGGGGGGCSTTWTCTEWNTCSTSEIQTRTCSYPTNLCTPKTTKPTEVKSCTYAPIVINTPVETTAPTEETNAPGEITATPTGFLGITGAAIGTAITSPVGIGVIVLVVIGLIGGFMLIRRNAKKKDKKEDKGKIDSKEK